MNEYFSTSTHHRSQVCLGHGIDDKSEASSLVSILGIMYLGHVQSLLLRCDYTINRSGRPKQLLLILAKVDTPSVQLKRTPLLPNARREYSQKNNTERINLYFAECVSQDHAG
jgi:hypothetical protein